MTFNIKAALLSAFAFPGLGQLYKGERIKGLIIFLTVNLLLLVLVCVVLQQLLPLILTQQVGNPAKTTRLLMERLHGHGTAVRFLLGSLIGLWFYGWTDAMLVKRKQE